MDFISLDPPGYPSSQTAFDIFRDRWVYKIPVDGTTTGTRETFLSRPPGIDLLMQYFPEHEGFLTLELGSHEGEQTFHLDRLTRAVYSIEGRPANFLKCLIVQNELKLSKTHFAVGDFHLYLTHGVQLWDLCYCVGVLYHVPDPVELLKLIARRSKRLILSTVIYDRDAMDQADKRTIGERFPTRWLDNISDDPEHVIVDGICYCYWRRKFYDGIEHQIIGQGASHSSFANLLDERDVRKAIVSVGGHILTFSRQDDHRSPHIHAVVEFL